jgi:hypothetical protein
VYCVDEGVLDVSSTVRSEREREREREKRMRRRCGVSKWRAEVEGGSKLVIDGT